PVMSQFGPRSNIELERLEAGNSRARSAQMLLEAGRTFRQFQSFCQATQSLVRVDANNMEELFCIAELLAARGESRFSS
ncbi:MAG TPA: hypothetical protein VLN25_08230, partial [Burkholderiaceae bacterium]|nr:hypothetical protein [Burkholderiaceae bacterium]